MRAERRVRSWLGCHPRLSCVLLAALVLLLSATGQRPPDEPPLPATTPFGWVLLVLACAALVLRLTRPVEVWLTVLGLVTVATAVEGAPGRTVPALLVAVYTVAAWRPWRTAVAAAAVSAVVPLAAGLLTSDTPLLDDGTYAFVAVGGMVGAIGIAVRNRRAVVAAFEERARIAEQTREEEAQRRVVEERLRIARELHDVVAHHISVVNVQAGVARHLLTADPAAADAALGTVRESAALVLREMGSILGLLRTTEDPVGTQPAPGVDRLGALVEESRSAGLDVAWTATGVPRPLAPAADLAAYRLAQEALTNARRHGTGSARITLDWTAAGLVVEVRNPLPATGPATPVGGTAGGGHGLVGMRERVVAAGGRIDAGRDGGSYVVRAELPYDTVTGPAAQRAAPAGRTS